jgi:hypothetical protein
MSGDLPQGPPRGPTDGRGEYPRCRQEASLAYLKCLRWLGRATGLRRLSAPDLDYAGTLFVWTRTSLLNWSVAIWTLVSQSGLDQRIRRSRVEPAADHDYLL